MQSGSLRKKKPAKDSMFNDPKALPKQFEVLPASRLTRRVSFGHFFASRTAATVSREP